MTNQKKMLILGGSGFVGQHLYSLLGPERSIATYRNRPISGGIYFDSLTMELSDILGESGSISHAIILLGDIKADSCAADVKKSQALNVDSIKSILDYLKYWRIIPVFTSTEVVFDGVKGTYLETDEPNPILRYGMQKVEIEEYMQELFEDFVIARLALVYGSQHGDGTVFTNWIDAIEQGQTSPCAYDYISSPIYVGDAVEALVRLMTTGSRGIFHLCSHKPLSRLQLYETLLSQLGARAPAEAKAVSCSIYDFNTLEKRPLDVSMIPDKLVNCTGLQIRTVESVCGDIARDYISGRANSTVNQLG